jgi:hypothetical protein
MIVWHGKEKPMATLRRALWVFSIVGALVGIYILVQAFRKAPTEQELANCVMMATACALVPFCLARAAAEISKRDE